METFRLDLYMISVMDSPPDEEDDDMPLSNFARRKTVEEAKIEERLANPEEAESRETRREQLLAIQAPPTADEQLLAIQAPPTAEQLESEKKPGEDIG